MSEIKGVFNPFRVLAPEEREAHIRAYRDFLATRDGQADVPNRTLAIREERMRRIESEQTRWRGAIDSEGFARAFAGDRSAVLDPCTEWILAAAKANEGERYGIEIEIDRFLARGGFDGVESEDVLISVMVQESYHCRTLLEVCRTFDIEPDHERPAWSTRFLLEVIGNLPARARWVPVLAGEIVGSEVFRLLRSKSALFGEQPEVRDRLHRLMTDIWIDEVLHVAYLRAQIGRVGIQVARALVPIVAWAVFRDVPQLGKLGCTPGQILDGLRGGIGIPREITWMADESGRRLNHPSPGLLS